jgi:hypothetical protein
MNLDKNSWYCKFYKDFYDVKIDSITTNGCKYLRNLIIAIILNVITLPIWYPGKVIYAMKPENFLVKFSYGITFWLFLSYAFCLLVGITDIWIDYNKSDFLYGPVVIGAISWFYIIVLGFFYFLIFCVMPWIIQKSQNYNIPKVKMHFISNLWRNISEKICFKINWTNKLTDNKEEK